MALAQLFYLREAVRRRARSLRHRWGRRQVPQQRSFTLEPLEGRLLLSADLTGLVTAHTLLDPSVPTNAEQATIRVTNSGDAKTAQISQVAVYASLDNTLDASDVLLGTANAPKTISAGQFKDVNVALQMPATLAAGTYNLLARVDATNVIVEGTAGEANNLTVGPQVQVAWQFGAVPGRTGNTTLTLADADGTQVTFSLSGPGLGEVIKDGSNWDLKVTVTTASSAVTITTNGGGNGRVTLNDVHVFGPLAAFTAAKTDLTGTLAIDGPVTIPGQLPGTITLGSIQGGAVAVPSVEALTILGSVTNAKIYVGTTLGQDGQPGGIGTNADFYGQGSIGFFTVNGSMNGATVRVGIDPVDGIFGNGNDTLIGGSASSIGGIVIGGALSADTRFIAGSFPAKYLVGGNLRPTAGDPHFISNFSGPSLTAALQQDTGASTSDRITNTPTIAGSLTDADGIATFTAGFGATPTFNVLADRQADGSFTLSLARLEEINGGPLTDGTYVLTLQATDTNGNPAQTTVSFTLDTTLVTPTLDLDPASDSAPAGDQQTANAIVMLVGHTEANALVELLGLGLSTTADGTGTFSFSDLALTLGAYTFTARATDQAGNQQTTSVTITRLLADSDGDGTPDSQETGGPNGGDANSDGIPDSQQDNVVSVLNSANQYVTLVAPAGAIFTEVQTLDNPSPGDAPEDVTFPLGFVAFQLTGLVEGTATVDLLLPDGTEANTYWQYGATPDNATPHWYEFLYDGTTGAEINGNKVTLYFQDGARGDSDRTVNGTIIDPSGSGFVKNHAPSGTDKTITINEDTPYVFTSADFGFSDVLDNPANGFQAVTITRLPSAGTLTLNGAPVNVGDSIPIPPAGATWTAREEIRDWFAVASSADGTKLVATTAGGFLYTSTDAGVTWTAREGIGDVSAVASSADGTKLIAANGSFLYTSTDSGVTWTAREGSPSSTAWWSVASSADGMKLVAGLVGGGKLYTSTDAGVTWTARASSQNWLDVASSADGTKLVAVGQVFVAFGQQPLDARLYTSTDAGVTWTAREEVRNWSHVASSADGRKLVAADYDGRLYTSTNAGVTWVARESNREWRAVASSADGTKLVAVEGATDDQGLLAGHLYTSTDAGVTWTAREEVRRWIDVASSADGTKLIAAVQRDQLYISSVGLRFTPGGNANGSPYTSFTFQVRDSGGTRNGGVDLDPSANTITINVTPVNDAPVNVVPGGQTTVEDTALLFTTANGNLIRVTDVDIAAVTVTLAVLNGALTLGGTTGLTGLTGNGTGLVSFSGAIADINAALAGLSYLPTLSFNGSDWLTLTTADGVAAPVISTVALTVTPVSYAPAGTDQTVTTQGNIAYSFLASDFGFTDPSDSPYINNFQAVTITTLPGVGTLTLNGAPVNVGDSIPIPPAGEIWTARASLSGGRVDDIASSTDGTKLVAALSGTGFNNGRLYVSTDSGMTWTAYGPSQAWISVASSADGTKLIAAATGGQLWTSTDSGVTWTAREEVRDWRDVASSADGMKLVAADYLGFLYTSTDSGVTWTAREEARAWWGVASSADGTKLIAATISGGIQGGFLYTSTDSGVTWTAREEARSWSSVASSADGTKLIAATFISDSGGGFLYTSTDAGVTWTAREGVRDWIDVASSADGMKLVAATIIRVNQVTVGSQLYTSTDAGVTWMARDESNPLSQLWSSVALSADGMALVAGLMDGQLYTSVPQLGLQFTPALNAIGSPYTSFTFQVQDDGGSLNGNVDLDLSANTITINVTPANDAPAGTDKTIAMPGDTAYSFALADFGFTDPNDSPADNFKAVTITSLPSAGTLTLNGAPVNVGDSITIPPAGEIWTARESGTHLWYATASSADGTKLVATSSPSTFNTDGQIYTSTDAGVTWTARESDREWRGVASSADGMKLVAAVTGTGGHLYTSTDAGVTWTARASNTYWWSVASSADGTKLVATTSYGQLWTSTDSGVTWTAREAVREWSGVASSADGTKLIAGTWNGRLYTSTDSGVTWTAREEGRVWYAVASSADGTKLIAAAVGQDGGVFTSTDSGLTWTKCLDGQFLSVASSANGTTLIAGNSIGLYISTDSGVTWTDRAQGALRYWIGVASSADGTKLIAAGQGGRLYTSDVSLGLVFTPDVNTNGIPYTSFTFQVQDDGGTLNGGVDLDQSANRITINVTALANVVPEAQTTLEDAALLFTAANGNPISVKDLDTATVTVTLAVTNGALTLAGTTGLTGLTGNGTGLVSFAGGVTNINAALNGLSFLPTLNFNGSDTLTLTTADGVAAPVLSTVALTITSVNDAPAGEDQTITTPEDTAYIFTVEDFGFSDPNDSPANNFQAVTITSLPDAGTLTLNGVAVNEGDSIPIPPAGGTWTPLTTPILSQYQSWYDVASSADGMKLVATAYGGQLYTSTDAGATWTARANDQYWVSVASSADGTKLVAAVAGGFLYTSTDSGVTWTERANDLNRNWWSVASSADGTRLVAAGFGGLYTSTDSGVTWTERQSRDDWFAVASSADGTKLVAGTYGGRLYTSTDAGATWTARASRQYWVSVASSADGTKLIAAADVGFADGSQLYTSTDAGVTWTAREEVRRWQAVASSADGTKLVAAAAGDGLYTSRDSGVTWAAYEGGSWLNVASSADGTNLVASGNGGLYTSNSSIGLVFTPDVNTNGTPYTSFTFKVQDDEDTLNGGVNLDPLANTITINVTA